MMRQQFEEIIGTPPASTVDAHALVRREYRARTARRVGLGTTAVAAAGITIALLANTSPAGNPPLARQPDTGVQLTSATRADAEASAGHLTAVVEAGVRTAAPEARWDPGLTVTVLEYGSSFGWTGNGHLRTPKTRGDLTLTTVDLPAPGTRPDKQPITVSCAGEPDCAEGTTANGRPIVTITRSSGTARWLEVRIGLASSRVMALSATNAGDSGEVVLTAAQVATVAQHVADTVR